MKKLLALLLAAALITLSTGCSGGNSPDNSNNATINSDKDFKPSRGTINGNVYENDYLGFKFTRPESWVYSTDEEIAAAMNIGADILEKDYEALLEENATVWDMMVRDTLTGTNISVTYENLKLSFSSNITEEQYIEALKQQFANVTEMTITFSDDIETVSLGGTEFTRGICNTEMSGINMTQAYYLRKVDTCMACVIVTLVNGYEIADVEAMFE